MKKSVSHITTDKLKYSFLVAICLTFCALLTFYLPQSKNGVSSALSICAKTVIPSLFPFMFLSSFMIESGVFDRKFKVLEKLSNFVFRLPQCSFGVFALSALGGFPVGGKMIKQLYEKNALTQNQAGRLLLFCVNPGPAFSVGVLGETYFGSAEIGYIIYFSILLSNILIALLCRFIADFDDVTTYEKKHTDIISSFVKSGSNCASSVINVCMFIVIFSCFESILEAVIENQTVIDVLSGTFEVTTGCQRLSKFSSIPLIASITAWAGVSVHCQIYDCIKKVGLDIKLFLTSRIASAGISAIICDILISIYPVEINAISVNATFTSSVSESSSAVSIAMLLTCCAFLAGDYSRSYRRRY